MRARGGVSARRGDRFVDRSKNVPTRERALVSRMGTRALVRGGERARLTSFHGFVRLNLADDRVLRQVGAHLTATASSSSDAFAGVRRARALEADTTRSRGGGSGFRFRKRRVVVERRVLARATTDVRENSARVVARRVAARRVVSHFEDVRDVATRGMVVRRCGRYERSRTVRIVRARGSRGIDRTAFHVVCEDLRPGRRRGRERVKGDGARDASDARVVAVRTGRHARVTLGRFGG